MSLLAPQAVMTVFAGPLGLGTPSPSGATVVPGALLTSPFETANPEDLS